MSSRSIVPYLRERPRTAVLLVVLGAAAVIAAVLVAPSGARRLVGPGDDRGAKLVEGLTVPAGARLVLPVAERPVLPGEPGSPVRRQALLSVNGDPLDVWDRLVDQARLAGTAVSGSAAACHGWDTSTIDPASLLPDTPDQPFLRCDSRAPTRDGSTLRLRLDWGASSHHLLVELTAPPEPAPEPVGPPSSSALLPDAAVPREQRRHLPLLDDGPTPAVGEVFGPRHDCFGDGSRHRFLIPAGAHLAADARFLGDRSTAVLDVDDAQAVVRRLADQIDRRHPDGSDAKPALVGEVALADGSTVWATRHAAPGGGSCRIWSTADDRHVVVETSGWSG